LCVVDLTIFKTVLDDGHLITLQIQDINKYHIKAEEYKSTLQQFNALTQLAPVAIFHIASNWQCSFTNEKWTEFSGLTQQESSDIKWINAIHPQDVGDLLLALRNSLQKGSDHSQEVRLVSPKGQTKWVEFNIRVLFDAQDNIEGFLGTLHDITERYVNQEKLRNIAEYDGLTGLASRMLFQDRLQQAFYDSERSGSVISVFFLDLDGFKDVNDSLGHDIGDVLLQQVANRLMNTLRKNDTVARFGGDEFVVMLGHDEKLSEVMTVAEKVIKSIAQTYIINEHKLYITTSLGIAQGNSKVSSPETLLKNADFALYSAKKEGKNKYQLFNETLEERSKSRVNLINDLRNGLSSNRFILHYQAINDVNTNSIVGFEALIRFIDKRGKLVSPSEFIPLLEDNNMIVITGAWVIDEVCRQLSIWKNEQIFPKNGYVSFNVSANQLSNSDLIKTIKKACDKYEVSPSQLVMEITESVIINKPKKVELILTQLRDLGLRIAIDDFGTGYSSLSYLQNLPFNILKVDKSFVTNLDRDSSNSKIVKAIVALAQSFDLLVIAEGVETTEAKRELLHLGASLYQGFLKSKPIDASGVCALLSKK
jgi:diguanylate cyclase (GGDEF)-like protein/PAS domain S-box-containing protein